MASIIWYGYKRNHLFRYFNHLHQRRRARRYVLTMTIDSQIKIYSFFTNFILSAVSKLNFTFRNTDFASLRTGDGRWSDTRMNKTKLEIETLKNGAFKKKMFRLKQDTKATLSLPSPLCYGGRCKYNVMRFRIYDFANL